METFWICVSLVLAVLLLVALVTLNTTIAERDAYLKTAAYWWNRWRKAAR